MESSGLAAGCCVPRRCGSRGSVWQFWWLEHSEPSLSSREELQWSSRVLVLHRAWEMFPSVFLKMAVAHRECHNLLAQSWLMRSGGACGWAAAFHGFTGGLRAPRDTQGHPDTADTSTLVQRSPKACWTNVPYCLEPRICYRTVPTGPNRIPTETKSELCFGGSFPAFADDTFAVFRFLLVEFLCMFPDSGDFLRIELATLN